VPDGLKHFVRVYLRRNGRSRCAVVFPRILMTKWVAYTDGACAPSNPGPAAWGAVVIAPDGGEVAAHSGFIGHGTNQIAEITAAIEGLTRTPEGAAVELVSDSQYVLKGLTEWRAGWERKGYRNSKGEPVANLALWKRLFALADKRKVTTRWVRGHNGDYHNEQADQLATAALRTARLAPAAPARPALPSDYTLPLE
jgi:ribonuclease HI